MQMYYYYSDQRGKKDKTATCFDLCKAIVFGKGGFLALDFRWPPPWKNKAKKIKFLKYKVNNILNFPFARRCFWTNTIPLSLWLCISFYIRLSEKPRLSWNNSSGRCLNSCKELVLQLCQLPTTFPASALTSLTSVLPALRCFQTQTTFFSLLSALINKAENTTSHWSKVFIYFCK